MEIAYWVVKPYFTVKLFTFRSLSVLMPCLGADVPLWAGALTLGARSSSDLYFEQQFLFVSSKLMCSLGTQGTCGLNFSQSAKKKEVMGPPMLIEPFVFNFKLVLCIFSCWGEFH